MPALDCHADCTVIVYTLGEESSVDYFDQRIGFSICYPKSGGLCSPQIKALKPTITAYIMYRNNIVTILESRQICSHFN
jgi:hypothetical protein